MYLWGAPLGHSRGFWDIRNTQNVKTQLLAVKRSVFSILYIAKQWLALVEVLELSKLPPLSTLDFERSFLTKISTFLKSTPALVTAPRRSEKQSAPPSPSEAVAGQGFFRRNKKKNSSISFTQVKRTEGCCQKHCNLDFLVEIMGCNGLIVFREVAC